MKPLRLTYDPEANAAYLRLCEGKILESEEISPGIILDFDAEGRILAIELLDARGQLPRLALDGAVLPTAA